MLRPFLALILFAIVILTAGINRGDLHGSTELREAGVAAEMLQDRDYLLPRLNGVAFLEKPPLSYWLQAGSIEALGYQPASPRLPSVLAGVLATLLFALAVARMTADRRLGLAAGLVLLTMASFWANAREAGQDALLALGIMLTLLGFHRAREPGGNVSAAWIGWGVYVIGLALATLAKGVIGLAIPGAAILAVLVTEELVLARQWRWRSWLVPGALLLVALLPLCLWLFDLYRAHGLEAVREVVWVNSVGRFAGDYTRGEHGEPFYYYLTKLPETFQPWTLLVFAALWQLRGNWRRDRNFRFAVCWLIAPFVLLSLSEGKRPTYLLSLYPAAALLVTLLLQRLLAGAIERGNRWLLGIEAFLISGVVLTVLVRLFRLHPLGMAGVAAVAVAGAALTALVLLWRSLRQRRWEAAFAAVILALACGYLGYGGLLLPHQQTRESAAPAFAHLMEEAGTTTPIMFRPNERIAGAARFYTRVPVREVHDSAVVRQLWSQAPTTPVLVSAAQLPALGAVDVRQHFEIGKHPYLIVRQAARLPSAAPH